MRYPKNCKICLLVRILVLICFLHSRSKGEITGDQAGFLPLETKWHIKQYRIINNGYKNCAIYFRVKNRVTFGNKKTFALKGTLGLERKY